MAGGNPTITAVVSAEDRASQVFRQLEILTKELNNDLRQLGKTTGLSGVARDVRTAEVELRQLGNQAHTAESRMHSLARASREFAAGMARASAEFARNAAMLASPVILHKSEQALHQGAERQSELVRLALAGIPKQEIEQAKRLAASLQTQFPIVDQSKLLERYKEIRSIVPDPHEAAHVLPFVAKTEAAMLAADPSGEGVQGLPRILKAAEILGMGQDLPKLERYLDSAVRAFQVMGKTISFEQLADFAKYSASAGPLLNEKFLTLIAPGLSQEIGGSTAGLGVRSLTKLITGNLRGPNAHPAIEEYRALGLVKDSDLELDKKGKAVGLLPGRHIQGYDVAARDPAAWTWDYLLPALRSHGITSKEEQIMTATRLSPNSNAARILETFVNQELSFKRHMDMLPKAAGVEGGNQLGRDDPIAQLKALQTSIGDFSATLSAPIMKDAAHVMHTLAGGIAGFGKALGDYSRDHEVAAKVIAAAPVAVAGGAAVGTYQLFSGVLAAFKEPGRQLNASALALDRSALALSAAAGRLGAAGIASGVGKAVGTAEGAAIAAGEGAITGQVASKAGWLARFARFVPGGVAAAVATGIVLSAEAIMQNVANKFDEEQRRKREGNETAFDQRERESRFKDERGRRERIRALKLFSIDNLEFPGQEFRNRILGADEIIPAIRRFDPNNPYAGMPLARSASRFGIEMGMGDGSWNPLTRTWIDENGEQQSSTGAFPRLALPPERPAWPGLIDPRGPTWQPPAEITAHGEVTGEATVKSDINVMVHFDTAMLRAEVMKTISEAGPMPLRGELGNLGHTSGGSSGIVPRARPPAASMFKTTTSGF